MKIFRLIFFVMNFLLIASCNSKYDDVYKITDSFVESLYTTYESYGVIGGFKYQKETADGMYIITPTGRLINVKINDAVEVSEYEELRKGLENHYKGDKRVNEVYINNGGTIMIDCRN